MRKLFKPTISIILLFSLLLSANGCKKKKAVPGVDSGSYASSCFTIPQKNGYESEIFSVLNDGKDTCISVVYSMFDKEGDLLEEHTDIFTVDDDGNCKYTLEILGNQPPCAVLENEYVFFGYKKTDIMNNDVSLDDLLPTAVFLDKKKGDEIRTIDTDFHPYYITPISDGFVIVGNSDIARYKKDGSHVKTLHLDFPCQIDGNGFFEENGKFYIIEEKDLDELIYHEVNFDTGICPEVSKSQDMGIIGRDVDGEYFFNPDGEYKVDLLNMKVKCLADWNNIDICPPKKTLYSPPAYHSLDDERFAVSYQYRDQTKEVFLFHHDLTIDLSHVETIKIGGYGVLDDEILKWAVYTFNTTHKDKRVILEDYNLKFDGYGPEERSKGRLALTQYFNEGNTPDIFYGARFDYSYMGRNGMVIDMAKYLDQKNDSILEMTDTAHDLMIDEKGACYQIFAGYDLYGRYVLEDTVNSIPDTSVFSLYEYGQKNGSTYSYDIPSDIVDTAIRYNFADLWGAYDGKRKISHEEFLELVSTALAVPLSDKGYASEEEVANGSTLMSPAVISASIDETEFFGKKFKYIGYPSLHGSVHLAFPDCSLAISSSAKNKDLCWDVVSMLLSEDAQKQTLVAGAIPVTKQMIDTLCDLALHPETVKDDALQGYVSSRSKITEEDVEEYLKTIETADVVATYDYGIFDIISDEIDSYYSQNRSPEQITETLEKRLTLYMQENYQ